MLGDMVASWMAGRVGGHAVQLWDWKSSATASDSKGMKHADVCLWVGSSAMGWPEGSRLMEHWRGGDLRRRKSLRMLETTAAIFMRMDVTLVSRMDLIKFGAFDWNMLSHLLVELLIEGKH